MGYNTAKKIIVDLGWASRINTYAKSLHLKFWTNGRNTGKHKKMEIKVDHKY